MTDTGPSARSRRSKQEFDYARLVARYGGVTVNNHREDEIVYAQGDPAEALYYIVDGAVKISVFSERGKEGVVALLGPGSIFGEGCLIGHKYRTANAVATSACELVRIGTEAARRALAEDSSFAQLFFRWVLDRNEKLKAGLRDQLLYTNEKRLARILLALANGDTESRAPRAIPLPITQETLAQMVGTTRARINRFMKKFRERGYVDYNGMIRVHDSLRSIFLKESPNVGNDRSPRW